MRLGLFGGSFDPVHHGHLALARCAREQAALDEVWFIPAAMQPLKPHGPRASAEHRLAMLRLAIAGDPHLKVSALEIERGGVSYTADTLREICAQFPDAKLFFLMGADALHDLPNWREPVEILRLATPLVVRRPGEPPLDNPALPPHEAIEMPALDISSSDIRRRLATGESIGELVPAEVVSYIQLHNLYSI